MAIKMKKSVNHKNKINHSHKKQVESCKASLINNQSNLSIQFNYRLELKYLVLSILLGYCYCVYCLGSNFIYNTSDISFLNDDALQHFLGWQLFRNDSWHWPLSVTENITYPQRISIAYTDSFPLLCIILKLISGLLPQIYIYQGIETVINCSLQFYFGCLLFRTIRNDLWLSIIGGIFCLFSPILLYRMNAYGWHDTLSSQWLILASLVLIFKSESQKKSYDIYWQLLLIFISLGTHAYIFFMIFVLAYAWLYKKIYQGTISISKGIVYAISIGVISLLSYYFFGYFYVTGSIQADGFGTNAMNLNSLFNTQNSKILPSLPADAEGYQYLGFGIILGLPFALWYLIINFKIVKIKQYVLKKYFGLAVVCIFLLLFSLSTKIHFGNYLVLDYSRIFEGSIFAILFNAFRSSGRLFWPVNYLILIFVVVKCYDLINIKNRTLSQIFILILCLIQIIDLKPLRDSALLNVANSLKRGAWNQDMQDQFWYNLSNYKHLNMLFLNLHRSINGYELYLKLGMIAALNNLSINTTYLARGSNQYVYKQINDFMNGYLDDDSIYIVDKQIINNMNSQVLDNYIKCREVDNYTVCNKRLN